MTNGHNKSVLFILLLLLLQLLIPLRYTRLFPLQNINFIYTHTYVLIRYYSIIVVVLATLIGYQKKTEGTRDSNELFRARFHCLHNIFCTHVWYAWSVTATCDVITIVGQMFGTGIVRPEPWTLLGEKINSTNFRRINLTRPVF